MVEKLLMRGSEAIAEAAIRAGCRAYFGYPITPQNELPEYMAKNLVSQGGVFIQSESELAAINMAFGASVAGVRVLTSSSSCGISLKQEGISYLAGCELPCVIVNINRGGPGLGNISPAQGDYFQATRGGGHGDYRTIVLAPASVQEMADLTFTAFDLADFYRNPVVILADGMLGQIMEPVTFKKKKKLPPKDWALTGAKGRKARVIKSLILDAKLMEEHNWKLFRKYERVKRHEVRFEALDLEKAKLLVVAYGTMARIAKEAVKRAQEDKMKVGLIRPITLWPFPTEIISEAGEEVSHFLVCEMNTGQMVEDVRLSLEGKSKVSFYGRPGGSIPTPLDIFKVIEKCYE